VEKQRREEMRKVYKSPALMKSHFRTEGRVRNHGYDSRRTPLRGRKGILLKGNSVIRNGTVLPQLKRSVLNRQNFGRERQTQGSGLYGRASTYSICQFGPRR